MSAPNSMLTQSGRSSLQTAMTTHEHMDDPITPKVNLPRIRDIGWKLWDPIRLLGVGGHFPGKWSDENNRRFADEYDSYLIDAAHQLRRGKPPEQVVDYLIDVEANHMGLGEQKSTRKRAQAVVKAMRQDDLIWAWPDEHGRFK